MSDTPDGLAAQDVAIGYGRTLVVKDHSLKIEPGQFTALLGPNGCGKSSILRSLAGLQRVQAGKIVLDGRAIASFGSKAAARRIGILAQGATAPEGLTVEDLVRQGRYPHRSVFGGWSDADAAAVEDALRLTGTEHFRHRQLDSLSGGQRQRAWIAMTLAQQSDILLLDEPTTYLDLGHQIEVLGLMRRLVDDEGATVVAVLHDLNQAARHADRLVLLHEGRIAASGTPLTVLTAENIAEVFGVDVVILTDPESGRPLCVPRFRAPPAEG